MELEAVVIHAQRIAFADGVGSAFTEIWPVLIRAAAAGTSVDEALMLRLEAAQRIATAANPHGSND